MFSGPRQLTRSLAALAAVLLASGCGPNWHESYEYQDDDPYDLYVLHELLRARAPGLDVLQDSLPALSGDTTGNANYLFVGNYAYYNEREITHLLDFVERGNTAFIAASQLPQELAEHLYGYDCIYNDFEYDAYGNPVYINGDGTYTDSVTLHLDHPPGEYPLVSLYNFKPNHTYHNWIPDYYLCDPALDNEAIGHLDSVNVNFVRLKWGQGNFYFNSSPLFFTNYYLVDTLNGYARYAEDALAVLTDEKVYWDEASRIPPAVARQRREQQTRGSGRRRDLQGRNLLSGNEALSYIQNQPPLALAWYLLIAAAVLYVVFRGKRRQRIIPIINRRENSSRRFIDTLSRLVFQKGNHTALARQELRSFKFYLFNRYQIRWNPGEPLPGDFSELTGADPTTVERAGIEIKLIRDKATVSESDLVRFYRALEPLYHL